MPLIVFRGVRKRFGSLVVLDGFDLEVERGEIVALLGPSGGGKTVILKLLVGLLRPDEGKVFFDGIDVASLDEADLAPMRRRIGFVFQGSALFDSLTVGENVAWPLRVGPAHEGTAVEQRVRECLGLVGLPGAAGMMPAQLSGGMRKRVAIARALATGPEALLYDEPTVGLDPANVRLTARLIVEVRGRLRNTALLVTHDREVAFGTADRVALLQGGRLGWNGTTEEARRAPPPALVEFLSGLEAAP